MTISRRALVPDFEIPLEELKARRNAKWCGLPENVIAAPVAEMDFRPAPAIQAAIERLCTEQDYGYPKRLGFSRPEHSMAQAYVDRMYRLYGWTVSRDLVMPLGDLVQATYVGIQAFSDEGNGVIVQVPAYPPFYGAVQDTRRKLLQMPMIWQAAGHVPDLEALRRMAPGAKILTLCNPQNPTGRVFTREELLAIGQIAIDNDLVILSDEIHSELVHEGFRHTPIATLSPDIAARTITLNSPTKSFNIPGLRCAVMQFGNEALMERFLRRIPRKALGQISVFGIEAAVAAWSESDVWLSSVLTHLGRQRDKVMAVLSHDMPDIQCHTAQAGYLAWLDCSALRLNMPAADFFMENAGVKLSAGAEFIEGGEAFARLNFATSDAILDEMLGRMGKALRG